MNTCAPRKFSVAAQRQSNSWRSTPCAPACCPKRRARSWSDDFAKSLPGYIWTANELSTSLCRRYYYLAVMAPEAVPQLTAIEALAAANGFLLDHLPDRYLAVEPRLDSASRLWRVKVVLTYPFIGSVGE